MITIRNIVAFVFLLLSIHTIGQTSTELTNLFKDIQSIQDIGDPEESKGHPKTYHFEKVEITIEKAEKLKQKVIELEKLELSNRQDQISRDIMIYRLRNQIDNVTFKTFLMPFNAEGGFYSRPVYFLSGLPFNTKQDYKDYLSWLPTYIDFLEYNQKLMKEGIERSVQRPKVIVENNLKLLQTWTSEEFSTNPFSQPFYRIPESISPNDHKELIEEAREVIMGQIVPAYQELYEFMESEYLSSSPEREGIINITNGREYYENRIAHFTTLKITPDSVFNLGKAEVSRIRAEMEKIIQEVEFEGDFAAFLEFLRTDPQFFAKTPEELLSRAAWLSKKAEGQLPRLFSDLYDLPFTVEPVPDAIAPNYTGGRYVPGSRENNRPGIYWVNTYDLPSRTLYTLPALTVHEAVPGHHLDMMNTASLTDVPNFRKRNYISAYGEGWGLYAEYLGEEMGMYSTPYERFGRYTYEMWRACRLVVDVGIHYKGWSRQQAVDYLASNSALSMHEVNTEIDRYIGWPGQAVSYKVGEITIKKLREDATKALGDEFDIQKFHAVILRNGSVPLPILQEEVQAYILEASN